MHVVSLTFAHMYIVHYVKILYTKSIAMRKDFDIKQYGVPVRYFYKPDGMCYVFCKQNSIHGIKTRHRVELKSIISVPPNSLWRTHTPEQRKANTLIDCEMFDWIRLWCEESLKHALLASVSVGIFTLLHTYNNWRKISTVKCWQTSKQFSLVKPTLAT